MLACNVMFIIANIREQGTMSNAHAVFIGLGLRVNNYFARNLQCETGYLSDLDMACLKVNIMPPKVLDIAYKFIYYVVRLQYNFHAHGKSQKRKTKPPPPPPRSRSE